MLTEFEEEVLGRLHDDYESARTLVVDLARDLKRSVTEEEVFIALLSLTANGFAQAYNYEPNESRYLAISTDEARKTKDPWFRSIVKQRFDETRERIRQIEKQALAKLRGGKPS